MQPEKVVLLPPRPPAARREGVPLTRVEAWMIHISNLLVGCTGLVYAWMIYLVKPDDPYAVVNHPWQPAVQHLHVLAAPLLVFAAGLIWRRHVWGSWRSGVTRRRRSGVGMALALVPMIASGYLLQTAVESRWRTIWVAVHLTTSALWISAYLIHQFLPLWRRLYPPLT